MVMLNHVVEHLHDSPRDLLNDLLTLVKPSGLLFITVPNAGNVRKRLDLLRGKTNLPPYEGYYWYPGRWRGHVREYVRGDLTQLCRYLGCEILELNGCDHMLQRLPPWAEAIYLALTAVFPGLKDSWTLVARKRPAWVPRKSLSENDSGALLARSAGYDYKGQLPRRGGSGGRASGL